MLNRFLKFYNSVDKTIFYASFFALAIVLITSLILLVSFSYLPDKIPLFYSLSWGENQLTTKSQLIIIPATLTVLSLINLIVSWHLHISQLILKRILNISSAVCAVIFFLAFLKIIFIYL